MSISICASTTESLNFPRCSLWWRVGGGRDHHSFLTAEVNNKSNSLGKAKRTLTIHNHHLFTLRRILEHKLFTLFRPVANNHTTKREFKMTQSKINKQKWKEKLNEVNKSNLLATHTHPQAQQSLRQIYFLHIRWKCQANEKHLSMLRRLAGRLSIHLLTQNTVFSFEQATRTSIQFRLSAHLHRNRQCH